jgi:hypothetical protein
VLDGVPPPRRHAAGVAQAPHIVCQESIHPFLTPLLAGRVPVLLQRHCGPGQVPGLMQDGGPVVPALLDLFGVGRCSSRVLVGALLQILAPLLSAAFSSGESRGKRVNGLAS